MLDILPIFLPLLAITERKKIQQLQRKYSTSYRLAHDSKPNINEVEVEITVPKCFIIRAILTKARLQY